MVFNKYYNQQENSLIMVIKKTELISIMQRLIKEIDLNCNDELVFEEDYYWEIKSSDIYDALTEPNLMLGQITEDWKDLSRLLKINNASISYDIKRLATILQLLEYRIGSDWILQYKYSDSF
jgi:hypothetical protein